MTAQTMKASGTYTYTGSKNTYTFNLSIDSYYENQYKGKIEWISEHSNEKSQPVSFGENKRLVGVEYVQGNFEPEFQRYTLKGTDKIDLNDVIILDEYYIQVESSGKLTGTTQSSLSKGGKLTGQATLKQGRNEAFSLEQIGTFDESFHFSNFPKPTFPWIKIYPEFPRNTSVAYFSTYVLNDKYIILISSPSEYQLKDGFFIDMWEINSGKYLGRSTVSVSDVRENLNYYRFMTIQEDWISFDPGSDKFYLLFGDNQFGKKKKNFIVTANLNQNLSLKKKDLTGAKEKKFTEIINQLGKISKFHRHFHKHGHTGFDNGTYAFVGWPVTTNNLALSWSDVTASYTRTTAQGIKSTTNRYSGIWELMLVRPDIKATSLLSIKNKPTELIQFLRSNAEEHYYFKVASDMLISSVMQSHDYLLAYKELPLLRESLQLKATKNCLKRSDKGCCQFVIEKYPDTPSANDAKKQLHVIESEELITKIQFASPEILESRYFVDNKMSNLDHGSFIFDQNLETRGLLQYLVMVDVTNPTKRTLSFVAEADLGVVFKESASVLGFSTSSTSKENHFTESAYVPDLKAGETRKIAFIIDLGYQSIEKSSTTAGAGINKQFEVTSKSVKAHPVKGDLQSIEASLIKQAFWIKKAQSNYPGKFKSFETATGLKSNLHPLDMRKQAFLKATSGYRFYEATAPTEISKALEGIWKGKYILNNVAEFDVDLILTAMDGKYFEGFIKYTLSYCKCPSLSVLYGEAYFEEIYGQLVGGNLVFDRIGVLSDRFKIRTSIAICRGLEDNKGRELSSVNPNTEPIQLAWKKGSIWELTETDPRIKEGKKFNLQLWKTSNQPSIRKYFDEMNKIIETEKEHEFYHKIMIKKVSSTTDITSVGVMVLARDIKNFTYLFGIADPLNSVWISANGKKYKLKYYSGISISNSERTYVMNRTSDVNCVDCGTRYRYFELYFERLPASVQDATLHISQPKVAVKFSPSDYISEYIGLNESLSIEPFAGFNLDMTSNYKEQRNPPNCKCFHPTTQELMDVWISSNLNCKNGLVNGTKGLVNFTNALVYSENWVNGKANGTSSFATRMHPSEPPKRLPTEQRNFQWVNVYYTLENNVFKTFKDKQFGWQTGALLEAYIKASMWLNGGDSESLFSGGNMYSNSSNSSNTKSDNSIPTNCVNKVEEYGKAFLRCNSKIKDPYYKVNCGNGKTKYFFYVPVENNSGLCSERKGYYELDQFFVNLGGFLNIDREKAIDKLCECN